MPERVNSLPDSAGQRVNAVPLANRNTANRPAFSNHDAPLPCFQSFGKLSENDPARLCGRLWSVGRVACGGGMLPPRTWLMIREPKSRDVSLPMSVAMC